MYYVKSMFGLFLSVINNTIMFINPFLTIVIIISHGKGLCEIFVSKLQSKQRLKGSIKDFLILHLKEKEKMSTAPNTRTWPPGIKAAVFLRDASL